MHERLAAVSWSLPAGSLFQTQIRVSVLYFGVAAILAHRLGWQVGLALTAILAASTLLHEFGHVFAARWSGGFADEILLWPLGGLASAQPGPFASSHLLTVAGGPLVNLLLCVATFPGFYASERLWGVLNPLEVPISSFSADWGRDILLLTFAANWLLLLLNLLPVYPLDGGQMLQAAFALHWPAEVGLRATAFIGLACSWALLFVGLYFGLIWVLVLGAITLVLNFALQAQQPSGEGYDESFMGYDFSQGYTSLERSARSKPSERRPGWFARWRQRRQAEKHARDQQRRQELTEQLDLLLAKVHATGIDSLTAAEKRTLQRASEELNDRSKRPR